MGDTSFGTWLKQQRRDLDLTQAELARQVGCSVSLLQKLESGHRRPSKQLAALLTAQFGLVPAQREALTREARVPTRPAHRLPPAPGLALFLAREQELAAIGALLAREDCRLITLIGPGGVGKTSLALQAARHAHAFAHGVCLVPLATVSDPALFTTALGAALDITFHNQAEPAAQLHDYLREKQLLLVLDNCEHLLAGVGLVAEHLAAAPRVKVLATSRQRLNVSGEWVVSVKGLAFPHAGEQDVAHYGAVQLFLRTAERARGGAAWAPADIAAAASIGRLVEGLPLAVELAAGWIALLPPQTIAEELQRDIDLLSGVSHDRPERHQSLAAVFEQSWRLLADDEQRVLRQLAVFQGGFSGGAAARVSGATLPILRRLVDASLLQSDGAGSYSLHKLVQQDAAKRLRAYPEEHARSGDAHCDYYTELFCAQLDHLQEAGHTGRAALTEMIEHVRAAWAWAVLRERLDQVERLSDGLCAFQARRGLYREGAVMLGEAALAAQAAGRMALLVHLQVRRAEFLYRLGQIEAARALLRQNRGALHGYGSLHDRARALLLSTTMADVRGCSTTARRGYQASLALAERAGAKSIAASALVGRAGLLRRQGAYPQARQSAEEGLRLALASGDHVVGDDALNILSAIAIECGDVAGARALCSRRLTLVRALENQQGLFSTLGTLVYSGWLHGNPEEVWDWCAEGLALAQDSGQRSWIRSFTWLQAVLELRRSRYSTAINLAQESLVLAEALDVREAIAQALAVMGWAQYELGRYVEAHGLVTRALAIFTAVEDHIGCVLALYSLGRTTLALDDDAGAWGLLLDALRRAQGTGATPFVPLILTTVAALLARAGAVERALVMLSLVIDHSASIPMAREEAAPLRAALVAATAPIVVATALEQSKGATFAGLADAVLRDCSAVSLQPA